MGVVSNNPHTYNTQEYSQGPVNSLLNFIFKSCYTETGWPKEVNKADFSITLYSFTLTKMTGQGESDSELTSHP